MQMTQLYVYFDHVNCVLFIQDNYKACKVHDKYYEYIVPWLYICIALGKAHFIIKQEIQNSERKKYLYRSKPNYNYMYFVYYEIYRGNYFKVLPLRISS
jgi:hypothetical protein